MLKKILVISTMLFGMIMSREAYSQHHGGGHSGPVGHAGGGYVHQGHNNGIGGFNNFNNLNYNRRPYNYNYGFAYYPYQFYNNFNPPYPYGSYEYAVWFRGVYGYWPY